MVFVYPIRAMPSDNFRFIPPEHSCQPRDDDILPLPVKRATQITNYGGEVYAATTVLQKTQNKGISATEFCLTAARLLALVLGMRDFFVVLRRNFNCKVGLLSPFLL